MRKIFFVSLVFTMAVLAAVPVCAKGIENFRLKTTYVPGQFADVPDNEWYSSNIQSVYEHGIMNGVSNKRFDVQGNVTVGQAIAIGCRIHQIYHETDDDLVSGDPWYMPYVDYAKQNSLVAIPDEASSEEIGEFLKPNIERYGFAMILSAALPDDALPAINDIEDGSIPDVDSYQRYSDIIYRLYRAGILSGNDEYGSFAPESTITRAEAAAIISRMIDPSLRKTFSLAKKPFEPVPMDQLANRRSIQKKATDEELAEAYQIACQIVEPLADCTRDEQLYGIAYLLRQRFESGMTYSMDAEHYNDPYGYLVLGSASCAGCTRTTGLCLSILGIPYEHVNEDEYSHQWCRVNVDGEYWICDAYGLYCGPEPAPYQHPYF